MQLNFDIKNYSTQVAVTVSSANLGINETLQPGESYQQSFAGNFALVNTATVTFAWTSTDAEKYLNKKVAALVTYVAPAGTSQILNVSQQVAGIVGANSQIIGPNTGSVTADGGVFYKLSFSDVIPDTFPNNENFPYVIPSCDGGGGGEVQADNGLSVVDGVVKLGGELTQGKKTVIGNQDEGLSIVLNNDILNNVFDIYQTIQ